MSTAVRYYSRGGNTKAMAEAIAKAAGVEAVSVDAAGAKMLCFAAAVAALIGAVIYFLTVDRFDQKDV